MNVIFNSASFLDEHFMMLGRFGDDCPNFGFDVWSNEWLSILRAPYAMVLQMSVGVGHFRQIEKQGTGNQQLTLVR